MNQNLLTIVHFVFGACVIGALTALGAVGTISGTQALTGISAITGLLLGAGAALLIPGYVGKGKAQ